MGWIIILTALFPVCLTLFIFGSFYFVGRNMRKKEMEVDRMAESRTCAATAKVLNIIDTGMRILGQPCCILDLEVTEYGKAPYRYELEIRVNKFKVPRIGDTVRLGRSENKPNELIYIDYVQSM